MAKSKNDATELFQRCHEAADDASSAECQALIEDLDALEKAEEAEWQATRPPGTTLQHRRDGAVFEVRTDPGPAYREAAASGDAQKAAQVRERHGILDQRRAEIATLRTALKQRAETAAQEEAKAAAPGELKARQKALPDLLARAEGALAEAQAALADCNAWLREVEELRELAEDDGEIVDAATLYRLGLVLRHRLQERTSWTIGSLGKPERDVPALFGSPEQLARAERLLGTPEPGLLDRAKRFVFGSEPTSRQEEMIVKDLRRVRRRLLAAGDVEAAGDFETLEKGVVGEGYDPRTARKRVEEFSG